MAKGTEKNIIVDVDGNFEPFLEKSKQAFETVKQEAAKLGFGDSSKEISGLRQQISAAEAMPKESPEDLEKFMKVMNVLNESMLKFITQLMGLSPEIQQKVQDLNKTFNETSSEITRLQAQLAATEEGLKTVKGPKGKESTELVQEALNQLVAGLKIDFPFGRKGSKIAKAETLEGTQERIEAQLAKTDLSDARRKELEEILVKIKEARTWLSKISGDVPKFIEDLKNTIEELKKKADSTQQQIAAIPAGAPGTPGADPAAGPSVLATTFSDVNKSNVESKKQYTKAVKESTKEEQKNQSALNGTNKSLKGKNDSVGRALNSVFKYGVALQFFRTIANQATRTVKELDKALTEQSIVTGKTRQETYKLLKSYQDLARQTGYTTVEIANIATQYFRQGKTQADALILTEAAAKAARISGISAGQSVNYLTTAVNGFMLSAKQAIDVSDKFAAIASQSASSYEELAIGLSKVASQANLAGMSIDYTLGLIAKGVETTREPAESIGTALKTIIARIRELSDYGKTLEDDMDLNNVEKQLQFVGVALRDQNGSLRSTQDVLDEIGRSWDTYSSNQQAAIARALAGTRQQSRLIAIMQDYNRTLELVRLSEESAGATNAQHAQFMQGLEAATARLTTAYQQFITALTNSDFIVAIVNTLGDMLTMINQIIEAVPGIGTFVTALVALGFAFAILQSVLPNLLTNFAGFFKTIWKGIKWIGMKIIALGGYKVSLKATAALQQGLAKGTLTMWGKVALYIKATVLPMLKALMLGILKAGLAVIVFLATNPIGWIILAVAAATAVIILLVHAAGEMDRAISKANKRIDELNNEIYNLKKSASAIDSTIAKFEALDKKIIKTQKDIEELNKLIEESKNLLSEEQQAFVLNLSPDEYIQYLRELSELQRSMIQARRAEQLINLQILQSYNRLDLSNDRNRQVIISYVQEQFMDGNFSNLTDRARFVAEQFGKELIASMDINNLWADIQLDPAAAEALKKQIDSLNLTKEQKDALKSGDTVKIKELFVTQEDLAILNNYYDKYAELVKSTVGAELTGLLDDEQTIKLVEELDNTNTSLTRRAEIMAQLQTQWAGNQNAIAALSKLYPELITLNEKYNGQAKEALQTFKATVQVINNFEKAMEKLGLSSERMLEEIQKISELSSFEEQEAYINALILSLNLSESAAEEARNAISSFMSGAFGAVGAAEEITRLSNAMKGFYKAQSEWSTMSAAERARFISENQAFFDNPDAAAAFFSGQDISSFLSATYSDQIGRATDNLRNQISAAIAEGNFALADELKAQLRDIENITQNSIDNIIKMQNEQIKQYKDMLNKEKKDTIDSLNARKEAYQKYFDAINKEYKEEDFEKEKARIQSQLIKLGAASDAESLKKVADLQKQLAQIEGDKAKADRDEAQKAVLESIDEEIKRTNEYYDQILNDNRLMLQKMSEQVSQNEDLLNLQYLNYLLASGKTEAEVQQAMNQWLQSIGSMGRYEAGQYMTVQPFRESTNVDSEGNAQVVNTVNIDGKDYKLDANNFSDLIRTLREAMIRYGYAV